MDIYIYKYTKPLNKWVVSYHSETLIIWNIATGEGFSNFMLDMQKTFMLIFAIPIIWEFLEETDQRILAYFVHACKSRISKK